MRLLCVETLKFALALGLVAT
eukprot:COSAG06_NODE_32999_length_497_cov_0.439698_2_plen_20_part_01